MEAVLELPQLEREKFCREISWINREANSQEKNLFVIIVIGQQPPRYSTGMWD